MTIIVGADVHVAASVCQRLLVCTQRYRARAVGAAVGDGHQGTGQRGAWCDSKWHPRTTHCQPSGSWDGVQGRLEVRF